MDRIDIINSRQFEMRRIQEEIDRLGKKRGELTSKYQQLELDQIKDLRLGDKVFSSVGDGEIYGLILNKIQVSISTVNGLRDLNDLGSLRLMEEKV